MEVDRTEYRTTYERSSTESTPKYIASIQVEIDFLFMERRKIVSTHMRTPVGNDPIARLENLSHSMGCLLEGEWNAFIAI
jgi:hypothetical protein